MSDTVFGFIHSLAALVDGSASTIVPQCVSSNSGVKHLIHAVPQLEALHGRIVSFGSSSSSILLHPSALFLRGFDLRCILPICLEVFL